MQWDLLPPLVVRTDSVSVAGLVEPAYDVGGDCFDYAANGPTFDLAIMDAMGHGLGSATVASLAMGSYRHDRREARSLTAMHTALGRHHHLPVRRVDVRDRAARPHRLPDGRLQLDQRRPSSPVAHPPGRVVGELASRPTPPWGALEGRPRWPPRAWSPATAVLLYTDGVTDARTPEGELFGIDRLIDLTSRTASDLLRPEEIVRQVVRAVLDHQDADLTDDATMVLVQWQGPPRRRASVRPRRTRCLRGRASRHGRGARRSDSSRTTRRPGRPPAPPPSRG